MTTTTVISDGKEPQTETTVITDAAKLPDDQTAASDDIDFATFAPPGSEEEAKEAF